MKTKAFLTADGAEPIMARTLDISASGMSITLPGPLKVGDTASIKFDLFFDGKVTQVTARAKATYCIYSGGEFKIGLHFLNLNLSAMTVLAKYLR